MIGKLSGMVDSIEGALVTIDVQGVGYEVLCSYQCIKRLSEKAKVSLVVFTEVREDQIRLFGFEDRLERRVFSFLTQVKGVGPRTALDIISQIDKLDLLRIIGTGDLTRLHKIKGIGKKTAERIILELKDKVAEYVQASRPTGGQPVEEAVLALEALGFSRAQAVKAVEHANGSKSSPAFEVGELVKLALQYV